jgi:hypothetical protein
MASQFLSECKSGGPSVEVNAHTRLDEGDGGARNQTLGFGSLTETLTKGGEGSVELPKGSPIGAGDTLLAFESGEIAACCCLRNIEFLAEFADRQIAPLQKELCQAGPPGFDNLSGNAHSRKPSLFI